MRIALVFILSSIFLFGVSSLVLAEEIALVADFDSAQKTNNRGQEIEVWLAGDGSDTTQSCQLSFVEDDALGKEAGHAVRLDYDVESENPAYNGMRMGLNSFDASGYKTLNFYIKGDTARGFAKQLKIELIGPNKLPSPFMVQGITDKWQKVTIPLSEFILIQDWTSLGKFVIVFADINDDPKIGTIYLDHVYFSKS